MADDLIRPSSLVVLWSPPPVFDLNAIALMSASSVYPKRCRGCPVDVIAARASLPLLRTMTPDCGACVLAVRREQRPVSRGTG